MSLTAKLLSNLTLEKDLSVDREIIEKGRVKHWWKTVSKNYGGIMLMNIVFVLFALPAAFLILFLLPNLEQLATMNMNFSGEMGIGLLGAINDTNAGAIAVYEWRLIIIACTIPCFTLMGVGAAGLFYCCRNYIWGAKVKLRIHFFRGIKKYWWQYMICFTVIGIAVAAVACSIIGYFLLTAKLGVAPWWIWLCMVLACIFALITLVFMVIYLPMIPMYKLKERDKIKNTGILSFTLLIPIAIVTVLMALPLLALLNSFTAILLAMFMILSGISIYALAMTELCQFGCDSFVLALYEKRIEDELRERKRQAQQIKSQKAKNGKGGKKKKR